jgi:HlyD family secretion protein
MPHTRSTLHRTLAVFACAPLLLGIAGCGHAKKKSAPVAVAVQAVQVQQQPITQYVHGGGTIFPLHQASLSPKISSPVRAFYAARGQYVHRGQLLAVLENRDLAGATVSASGSLDQAKANYTKVVASSLPEQIQAAELGVKDAGSSLEAQQKLYDSYLWLYQQHAGARKQVDQAAVALTVAKSQDAAARKKLADLQASGTSEQTNAAQGQVESARGQYLSAKAQFEYTHLRSPIAGVVADRSVYPGDVAQAGTPLITVMDVSRVFVRLHLPHSQSVLLKVGDLGEIHLPGIKHGVAGKVAVISPALDPNSTTVEVWFEAANPDNNLQPGTSVTVDVVAKVVPNALVIPLTAVLTDSNGAHSVMAIAPGDMARRQPITTGIETNGVAQVVAGLNPGETIIATGAYGLPDNTKVKPTALSSSNSSQTPAGASSSGSSSGSSAGTSSSPASFPSAGTSGSSSSSGPGGTPNAAPSSASSGSSSASSPSATPSSTGGSGSH